MLYLRWCGQNGRGWVKESLARQFSIGFPPYMAGYFANLDGERFVGCVMCGRNRVGDENTLWILQCHTTLLSNLCIFE